MRKNGSSARRQPLQDLCGKAVSTSAKLYPAAAGNTRAIQPLRGRSMTNSITRAVVAAIVTLLAIAGIWWITTALGWLIG
jgi:hypothetical protein